MIGKVYTLVFENGVFITEKANSFVKAMELAEDAGYTVSNLLRANVWRNSRKSVRSINFLVGGEDCRRREI